MHSTRCRLGMADAGIAWRFGVVIGADRDSGGRKFAAQAARYRFEIAGVKGTRRGLAGGLEDRGGGGISFADADRSARAADGEVAAALSAAGQESLTPVCADELQAVQRAASVAHRYHQLPAQIADAVRADALLREVGVIVACRPAAVP